MSVLRKLVNGDLVEEIPFIGGLKSAKQFVDDTYPFDPEITYEFSEVNPENRNENTTKIIPKKTIL